MTDELRALVGASRRSAGRAYAVRCPCGGVPVLTARDPVPDAGFSLSCRGCGRWFDGYDGTVRAEGIP